MFYFYDAPFCQACIFTMYIITANKTLGAKNDYGAILFEDDDSNMVGWMW